MANAFATVTCVTSENFGTRHLNIASCKYSQLHNKPAPATEIGSPLPSGRDIPNLEENFSTARISLRSLGINVLRRTVLGEIDRTS